jgi:hypothetical protein
VLHRPISDFQCADLGEVENVWWQFRRTDGNPWNWLNSGTFG